MPKGYLVANIRVEDQEKFSAFAGMAAPVIKAHGGKVLARGPNAERHEGDVTGIVMMIEFDSLEVARRFYLAMTTKRPKLCGTPAHRQILCSSKAPSDFTVTTPSVRVWRVSQTARGRTPNHPPRHQSRFRCYTSQSWRGMSRSRPNDPSKAGHNGALL